MADSIDEVVEKLLSNQRFINDLASRIYDKIKDEVVIRRLEENSEAIRSLQEAIKELQEVVRNHSEAIKELQKTVKEQGEAIKSLQGAVKELQETVKEQGEAIKSLQRVIEEHTKLITKLSTEIGSFTSGAGKGLERTIM